MDSGGVIRRRTASYQQTAFDAGRQAEVRGEETARPATTVAATKPDLGSEDATVSPASVARARVWSAMIAAPTVECP